MYRPASIAFYSYCRHAQIFVSLQIPWTLSQYVFESVLDNTCLKIPSNTHRKPSQQ